jgi:diguanylate cyclase (GGDEF)-like protein
VEATTQLKEKQSIATTYQWLIIGLGTLLFTSVLPRLPLARIDFRFLLIAALTLVVSARVAVKIPRFNVSITISDTFIFLAILLYGGEAAILLAAADGLIIGARAGKKVRTILFSAAVMASSTWISVLTLSLTSGPPTQLVYQRFAAIAGGICAMAMAQYLVNTALVAMGMALRHDKPFWQVWTENCIWASVTYFAGAIVAAFIAYRIESSGLYIVVVAIPMLFVLYFTYQNYLKDIRSTAAKAEQAERDRAEAERARADAESQRAEQAERHVDELNHYISELERTSRALQESKEHFRHAAFHDSLTDLPNRSLFSDYLKLAIERSKRQSDYLFAVLFLDLDRFKYINDSLGHSYGDQLIIEITKRLQQCLRQVDTVSRFGGDEFAILLDGIKDPSDAIRVAEKIQHELTRPFELGGHEAFTSASIGIALSTAGYDQPDYILRDADTAMYRAKDAGKACYELFDLEMHSRAVIRMRLENDLRRALERNEFCVYYQPIMSVQTERLSGFEALVRWQHPERGLVSPQQFIPIAEETGLIVPLGSWILEEACRQMQEWHLQHPANRTLTMNVNLSSKQLIQSGLVQEVKAILQKTGLPARSLKLEITESVVMENAELATNMLKQLSDLNVHLCIDDFGTGYSSLSYLHRFPVDTLKIDRSFVNRIEEKDENVEIVRTIATLARNLGMEVVAEGVESQDQLACLKALNCEYAQGYLFSRPLTAAAASHFIESDYDQRQEDLVQDAHYNDAVGDVMGKLELVA